MDRMTRTSLAIAASIISCCAVPNADSIRKALDEGSPEKALALALDDSRSLDMLAMEHVRRALLDVSTRDQALGFLPGLGLRGQPLLRDLAASADDPVVAATARSVLYTAGERGWREELEASLGSGLGLERAAAVEALVRNDPDHGFLERFIVDTDPAVRTPIVQWLAAHRDAWALELLVEAARKDPDPGVRTAALRALDPADIACREALKDVLVGGESGDRMAAATALGSDPASADLTWAAQLLVPPATGEGIAFAVALLRTDGEHPKALSYMTFAISDESPTRRHSALVALSGVGIGVPGLEALASDPNPEVRVAWCRLARKLGMSDMSDRSEILEAIASSSTPDDPALDALLALAEEKDGYETVRDRVWSLMKTGEGNTQLYVLVHAIRPFGDPSLAIWAMKHAQVSVRLQAAASWLAR